MSRLLSVSSPSRSSQMTWAQLLVDTKPCRGAWATNDNLIDERRLRMTETKTFSYATHVGIKFDPLTLIDVNQLANSVTDQWYNQTLCRVNDSVVRLGVMQGEYHWHKHDADDEFFFVLDGRFLIDLEPSKEGAPGKVIELRPREGFTVPKGVIHRTRPPER